MNQEEVEEIDSAIIPLLYRYGVVALRGKPVALNGGGTTCLYVSTRKEVTHHPDLLYLLGFRLARIIWDAQEARNCLIGVPMAGINLAIAASMVSVSESMNGSRYPILHYELLRPIKKAHGTTHTWVDGEPNERTHYWLIENATTTGDSVVDALEKLEEDGYKPERFSLIILVNRNSTALERLSKRGFKRIIVVYELVDLVEEFIARGFWDEYVRGILESDLRTQVVAEK
ncbi:MAG: hypothetical protein A3J50_01675 [Candidatus Woykebacteria bacterium RIFCSPHIGHO2_02_FULL_43_16b]|uniref:Orotate phosphoribosyltransferase n=1 Tax=Candidatus Woykebacteria bacterium RIFCSPHIGHO2_02_FULL_43_16b TaxID=1802601 RepID=A0A1G1WQD0_9BACT|nr:MAG: hypothetical protein A3J50_01675 [Candidatus Woykebacteria bacterium RIFCSPHIGHO2_02_FULL_43_16b]